MLNSMQKAIIQKDLRFFKTTKGNIVSIVIVALMFGVAFPAMFIGIMYFVPEDMGDFGDLLGLMPGAMGETDMSLAILSFVLNNIIPAFFLMIPVIATTAMATASFVGEKEKRTLETLLYSPLSLRKIFSSKVLSAFLLSMISTVGTFIAYLLVSQTLIYFMFGSFMLPGVNWYITVFLVAPALTLLAVTITSKISAKAQSMEEAFQKAGLITLPIVLLAASQFTGLMMLNAWILLVIAALVGAAAFVMLKSAVRNYNYEMLLK